MESLPVDFTARVKGYLTEWGEQTLKEAVISHSQPAKPLEPETVKAVKSELQALSEQFPAMVEQERAKDDY